MKSARNPLLISAKCTQISQAKTLSSIANDIKANDVLINNIQSKVQIINGANGSGKTTYLKMVALNIVLAQIGCFVPC